jgi:hypothetical protein
MRSVMLNKLVAVVLCAALAGTGCASASGTRIAQPPQASVQDKAVLGDYVQRLAAGSKVRVERTDGSSLRGTLMKATPQSIVVQKNTRVPEAPLEIPLDQLARVTLDSGSSSVGKTVGISVGVGVGATFGVLLLLAALLGD